MKGAHVALRAVRLAPEHVAARRLARQRRARPPMEGKPRVLILTPKDWAAHVQWDAMVANALHLRGASVEFATCGGGLEVCDRANTWESPPMPCRSCSHYVRTSISAHGFPQHELSALWDDVDADWPELDHVGLADLWDVMHGDLPLGDMISIPVRWFLMAADIDTDPLAPVTVRRFLRSARRIAEASARLLDDVEPDVVVMTNGLFLFETVMRALCEKRSIDVVTYERGLIKETLVFERNGIACLFDLENQWLAVEDERLDESQEATLDEYLGDRRVGGRTIDRYWKSPDFRLPPRTRSGRLVALFSNLTWDSAVIGQAGAYESIRSWLLDIVDQFADLPQHELWIRAHPAEIKLPGKQTREPLWDILASIGQLPDNVRFIAPEDPTSSYPIMEASDIGLVFSSTVGLEMAIAGKPVLVGGRTHYKGKGFTLDPADPEEHRALLAAALDTPDAYAPDRQRARRYAHLFFFEHPIRSTCVEEHVLGLARILVRDLDEIGPGVDADVDRVCDLILQGTMP